MSVELFPVLLLFHIPILVVSTSSDPPGFEVRVTKPGLDYANRVASNLLNDQIRSLRVPDIEQKVEGGGLLRLKNIRLVNFAEPTYSYVLNPPSTFTWKFENASVEMNGDWWGKKRVIILLEGSGTLAVNASQITVSLSVKLGRNSGGQPIVTGARCLSNVGQFQLDVKGGLIASAVNAFRGQISDYIKPKIERELCVRARHFLLKDVNAKLGTFPVETMIHQAFKLDYSLVADPKVEKEYMEISLKGRLVPSTSSIPSPHRPQPLSKTVDGNRMFYAWGSDKILNDLFFYSHHLNITQYRVTKDTPGAGSFLRLRCNATSTCLGSVVTEIADMFPPTVETAEAFLSTSEAPKVLMNGDGTASLLFKGLMDVYVHVPNANDSTSTKKSIALCSIDMKTDLLIRVENMRLVGSVNISRFDMRILETQIDPFTAMIVEASLPGVATPMLANFLNERLKNGFPIPVTHGITLKNPQINLLLHTVQVESDVQYVG